MGLLTQWWKPFAIEISMSGCAYMGHQPTYTASEGRHLQLCSVCVCVCVVHMPMGHLPILVGCQITKNEPIEINKFWRFIICGNFTSVGSGVMGCLEWCVFNGCQMSEYHVLNTFMKG